MKKQPELNYLAIGQKLREIRKKNGVTQEEIAKEFRIRQFVVSRAELGRIPEHYYLRYLTKFCKKFGVSMDAILGLEKFQGRSTPQ